jgi:hypothetical protein
MFALLAAGMVTCGAPVCNQAADEQPPLTEFVLLAAGLVTFWAPVCNQVADEQPLTDLRTPMHLPPPSARLPSFGGLGRLEWPR